MRASLIPVTIVAFLLSACMTDFTTKPAVKNPLAGSGLTAGLEEAEPDDLGQPFVRAGLEALERGDLKEAQKDFNRALKFDPANSQLHYLNGLTYHLRAEAGDTSQTEYAAIGYKLALQHDPANHWAAYQMGHLNFSDQRYREAQEASPMLCCSPRRTRPCSMPWRLHPITHRI